MTQAPTSTELADPLADLDGEDLACLGMRRADAWSLFPARTDEDWQKLFAELQAAKGKPSKPPKPRKPSIRKLVEQAEKATGKAVTAVTMPDGTRIELSGAPDPATESNPWRADLQATKQ
jgi:hypothetical protein